MKNYQIEASDGTKHWISRSPAVAALILTSDDHVLAVKRGKGAATHQGLWCFPCGYLEYDETLKQACVRELLEETNLSIEKNAFKFYEIDDDPKNFNQNVSIIFYVKLNKSHECYDVSPGTGGEPDEIEEAKWIPFEEIGNYKWAFKHDEIFEEEWA